MSPVVAKAPAQHASFVIERRISVSLATIEFEPDGTGTRLRLAERGAFLDGYAFAAARLRSSAPRS